MPVATADSKESLLSLATEDTLQTKLNDMELDLEDAQHTRNLVLGNGGVAPVDVHHDKQEKPEPSEVLDLSAVSKPVEEKATVEVPVCIPNPNQHTVIIFDWDDTLLASSFLHQRGYRLDNMMPPNEEVDSGLKLLEESVIALLTHAQQFGEVNIVTNAETGWVQLSAQKFMPGVVPLLEKIHVISARSTYEADHPDSPLKWKYHAMEERLGVHFVTPTDPSRTRHVISFGDSHVEREAVRTVTKQFEGTRTKSVKFAERPSMEQLRRQIELVSNCFSYIYSHDGDLDLMLTISVMY